MRYRIMQTQETGEQVNVHETAHTSRCSKRGVAIMPIIFSTIPVSQPAGTRVFFQAPDDALLADVVAEVASILGRHQAYVFHEPSEVPAGRVPVVLGRAELALDTGRTQEIRRRNGKAA